MFGKLSLISAGNVVLVPCMTVAPIQGGPIVMSGGPVLMAGTNYSSGAGLTFSGPLLGGNCNQRVGQFYSIPHQSPGNSPLFVTLM